MFGFLLLVGLVAASSALPSRIIGGHDIDIVNAPYQLSLQRTHHHMCGAVLISNTHALTSAICVKGTGNTDFSVRAGSQKHNSGGVVVEVKEATVHPQWSLESLDYDIAVLTLANPLELSNEIAIAKLPSADYVAPTGQNAVLTGWGIVKEGTTNLPDTLQSVDIPIISKIACRALYQDKFSENMVCAGRPIGGIGTCNGDSGAPLVVDGQIIGVASWQVGCARPNYPDVFSFVPKYLDFINGVVNGQ